jgi:hypothetical protein
MVGIIVLLKCRVHQTKIALFHIAVLYLYSKML